MWSAFRIFRLDRWGHPGEHQPTPETAARHDPQHLFWTKTTQEPFRPMGQDERAVGWLNLRPSKQAD